MNGGKKFLAQDPQLQDVVLHFPINQPLDGLTAELAWVDLIRCTV